MNVFAGLVATETLKLLKIGREGIVMRVKDVLKNFDFMGKVRIFEENEELCYDGLAFDCPWVWAEMVVATDENGEGIFVEIDKNTSEPYLGIYVKEE